MNVENTSDKTVETTKKLINYIHFLNEKIMAIEKQFDRKNPIEIIKEGKTNEVSNETIIDIEEAKVDNEQPTTETPITQTENNIFDNKQTLSFLQKISKWIISQFKKRG